MEKITAKKVVLTSVLVDVSDVVLNAAVAWLSGSVVMLAEFAQSIADFTASSLLYVGLRSSAGEATQKHPFGRGRDIYFWGLLSAFIMFTLAAGLSFYFGYQRFLNPQPVENIYLTFAVLAFAVASNGYSFSLSLRRILGKMGIRKIGSIFFQTHLVETKNILVYDLMGSVAALLGLVSLLLYQTTGILHFDGIGAMAIGLVLAVLAVALIVGIRDLILGRSAPAEIEDEIRKTVLKEKDVEEVLDLRTVMVGSDRILVNLEIHVTGTLTVDEAEALIDRVKARLEERIEGIQHVQIELETPD